MIRKLMFRLLPVQIILMATSTVNMLVSSYFASNFVGTEAMGAVGLYGPLNTFFGAVAQLLVAGSAILCGEYLGKNPVGKSYGYGHYGWAIWAGIFLLSLVLGIWLLRFTKEDLHVRSRKLRVFCIVSLIGILLIILLVRMNMFDPAQLA